MDRVSDFVSYIYGRKESPPENVKEESLLGILNRQWHTDVAFLVGEQNAKEFKAHRLILAMRSPVFETMLFGHQWAESKDGLIRVPDICPNAFQELLTYCYETEHPRRSWKSIEEAFSLYAAANKYLLSELRQECENYLDLSVKPDTVFEILKCADQFDMSKLRKKCLQTIAENDPVKVIGSEVGFNSLSAEHLEVIVSHMPIYRYEGDGPYKPSWPGKDQATEEENELFAALLKWAEAKCVSEKIEATTENRRKVLGKVLLLVDYFGMTSKGFLNGPGTSNIFTNEEIFAILANKLQSEYCDLPESLDGMPERLAQVRPTDYVYSCLPYYENSDSDSDD